MTTKLYTYWRSQAAFRVRIALALKGITAEKVTLDLLKGHQNAAEYRALNPGMVVPTLIDGDGPPLVQSLAILEYLDEEYPKPPLLPADIRARAHARALAQMVAVDAHPFIVPRVRKFLEEKIQLKEKKRVEWVRHWLDEASRAVEEALLRDPRTGIFCVGDAPTIADICLVAHFASVKLFGARDISQFPIAQRIFTACMALDAFAGEHPLHQPDAPAGGEERV
ncbi:MAG: maleylacetoacetate isomerase [Rhizobiales bacterium]|nr:maleylacetoacetate isomerase [Hyphomicrobiales bacterium]